MREAALLGCLRVPTDVKCLPFHRPTVQIEDPDPVSTDCDDLAVLDEQGVAGFSQHGRDV